MKNLRAFRFGSVSAEAARGTTWILVILGSVYFVLVPLLVYAVPCVAAFKKTPKVFWRSFTLASIAVAVGATVWCTRGFAREFAGEPVVGFPLPHPAADDPWLSLPLWTNALLVSGCCLLPLGLLSTIDTIRKAKA